VATLREETLVALGFVAIAKADAEVGRGRFALRVSTRRRADGWTCADTRLRGAPRRTSDVFSDAGAGHRHELHIRRAPPPD